MKWDATSNFLDASAKEVLLLFDCFMSNELAEVVEVTVRLALIDASSCVRNISGVRLRVFISSILRSTWMREEGWNKEKVSNCEEAR